MSAVFPGRLAPPEFGLVDCHVHLGPSDSGEIYYPPLTGDEYLRLGTEAGVERACAFAPYRTDGYGEANRALADWCGTTDGRVVPFARLGGRQPVTEPAVWMARRALRQRLLGDDRAPGLASLADLDRFGGVKLLPHLDGLPDRATFDAIAERGLPVLIHGGAYSSPRWIERHVLPLVPGPLIVAHLGSFPSEPGLLNDAIALASRTPNVWLDTSGVALAAFVADAAERVPEKLLFGSDCPLAHPGAAWAHLASVVADPGLRRRIGREAAHEVLGWA